MGRLIKNHWARLVVLTAAVYQIAAAFEGFFWPKIFWDFATTNLDAVVKPVPILQLLNLFFGIFTLAFEWPLGFFKGKSFHRAIETRLVMYPLFALAALIMYQSTNPGIYYIVGLIAYFWAYSEGEMVCPEPWTLPQRGGARTAKV